MKCFCFKVCVSNDQIVRVWKELQQQEQEQEQERRYQHLFY